MLLLCCAAAVAAVLRKRHSRSRHAQTRSGIKLGAEDYVMTSMTPARFDECDTGPATATDVLTTTTGQDHANATSTFANPDVAMDDSGRDNRLLTGTNFVWAGDADRTDVHSEAGSDSTGTGTGTGSVGTVLPAPLSDAGTSFSSGTSGAEPEPEPEPEPDRPSGSRPVLEAEPEPGTESGYSPGMGDTSMEQIAIDELARSSSLSEDSVAAALAFMQTSRTGGYRRQPVFRAAQAGSATRNKVNVPRSEIPEASPADREPEDSSTVPTGSSDKESTAQLSIAQNTTILPEPTYGHGRRRRSIDDPVDADPESPSEVPAWSSAEEILMALLDEDGNQDQVSRHRTLSTIGRAEMPRRPTLDPGPGDDARVIGSTPDELDAPPRDAGGAGRRRRRVTARSANYRTSGYSSTPAC